MTSKPDDLVGQTDEPAGETRKRLLGPSESGRLKGQAHIKDSRGSDRPRTVSVAPSGEIWRAFLLLPNPPHNQISYAPKPQRYQKGYEKRLQLHGLAYQFVTENVR